MRLSLLPAAAALALLSTPVMAASLTGDVVTATLTAGGSEFAANTAAVSPSVTATFTPGDATISATISDGVIDLFFDLGTFPTTGGTSTWTFTGLDFTPAAAVSALTLVSGDAAIVSGQSFTADSITIEVVDLVAATHGVLNELQFSFAATEAPADVPLPAAAPLALLGLAALGVIGRRRG
ncbi:PEP-CTERM sorting domain-containing protein [Rhodovulum sp. DZ06]|uniref:PEP-CTERM sorting domain-containing protein n=1 Tax=Rhodovulum sp. DZ06 TaxID=3425126 RepID=UPI003D3315F8